MQVRRIRAERFGAMVATDAPPALVAVDRVLARRLGVDGGPLWEGADPGLDVDRLEGPTEAHVALTERCPAGCQGCYADATPEGHEPSLQQILQRLDVLAKSGAFSVAFGGGEASLRDDLDAIVVHARSLGLTPTLTTSGLGVTEARLDKFRGLAQVNVSWDGPAEVYASVRGYRGASAAERAVRVLQSANIPVGINTVLTRRSFDALDDIAHGVQQMGAVELQLLRFKPSGRGRLDYLAQRLTRTQRDAFADVLRAMSARSNFAVRIDCALVPFIASSVDVGALRAFAVTGCEPGRSLMTVDAHGRVSPCSFWSEGERESLGTTSWNQDALLNRFRQHVQALPEPCSSCPVRAVCRGGCRIVSGHLNQDAWTPDPECPRVLRYEGNDATDAT